MLSRIFWIGIAGIALIAGIVVQDGRGILSWGDDHHVSAKVDRAIEERVEGSFDKMQIVDSDGRQIELSRETRKEFGEAVGRLVKAEANLALLGVRDASDEEIQAATVRRDQDAVREQIRQEIHDDVHSAVRDAVRE
jgi:hypothetical protein